MTDSFSNKQTTIREEVTAMLEFCELTVGQDQGDFVGNTNAEIQAAVDKAAQIGGGTVKILPGRYVMHDSLHMKSGVKVEGTGRQTVLFKPQSTRSSIVYYLGYGHYDIAVAEPDKFKIGTGVYVTDDRTWGFYSTVATITWKNDNELGLSRMLNADILPENNGKAISVYPVVSFYRLNNAAICNLTIEGNSSANDYLNGCIGGGIYMLQAHNVTVRNVTVQNFNGEGISFQQCIKTLIENCSCIANTGNGLHPGSGSVGAVIRNTVSRDNAMDGIYYCLRVAHYLCENNLLEGNKGNGISIGHRDMDGLIRGNRIVNNGKCGIYFRQDKLKYTGHRTMIDGNTFDGNCMEDGNADIVLDSSTKQVVIINNIFRHRTGSGKKKPSITVQDFQEGLVVYNNTDNVEVPMVFLDEKLKSGISFTKPPEDYLLCNENFFEKSCLHLGVLDYKQF